MAVELRAGTLSVFAALAAAAAAETAAEHATRVADTITRTSAAVQNDPGSIGEAAWRRCPDAWRVVQAGLVRFDDGTRLARGSASRTIEQAAVLQRAVVAADHGAIGRTVAWAGERPVDLGEAATSTRYMVNQLPEVARTVGNLVRQGAIEGRLMARARNLPRTEARVAELVNDEVVIVAPADVDAVLLACRVATRLSAALAVELDRSAAVVGRQPQPGLVGALARLQPARRLARDSEWIHAVAAHPAAGRVTAYLAAERAAANDAAPSL